MQQQPEQTGAEKPDRDHYELPECRHDYLVVVPTVGDPATVLPTVRTLISSCDGTRTAIVVSINPVGGEDAGEKVARTIRNLPRPEGVDVLAQVVYAGPCGFGGAVNRGLREGARNYGLPSTVVVLNDDTRPAPGWLPGLRRALDTETVWLYGEPDRPDGTKPDRDARLYGRVGLAGPCSNNVAGVQRMQMPPEQLQAMEQDPRGFCARWAQVNAGNVTTADFLSGFCIALERECLLDLAGERLELFDERFVVGGFEDNDLMVRAERLGWRRVVAGEVFVPHLGHQTLDKYFPGAQRGMANRLAYYRKWAPETRRPQRVVAAYRVGLRFANDLHLLRGSLKRMSELVDGIAVLLTKNPLEVIEAYDFQALANSLPPEDRALLRACNKGGADEVQAAFTTWLHHVVPAGIDDAVEVWQGEWNERDERNAAIGMAEALQADWVFSVDHDEVPEQRLTREHIDRLTRHPDPLVMSWDLAWVNFWDGPRLYRHDRPWGDGNRYGTSMRGFRLWRVTPASPRRIIAGTDKGLHCGNSPDFDPLCKRVAALRMLHYGYVRVGDRHRKAQAYRELDPTPEAALVGGGGYEHLVSEAGMLLSAWQPNTGVGLSMLTHENGQMADAARWLDLLYGLLDAAVLVWTGAWDPEQPWTGPSDEYRELVGLLGGRFIHKPLDEDFASARNAGLGHLAGLQDGFRGPHWALTLDPDEFPDDGWTFCQGLRRMAERADNVGWIFQIANMVAGGNASFSETLRMVRLHPGAPLRYHGRVHETFDAALGAMRDQGIPPLVPVAPVRLANRGLSGDDEAIEKKLRFYQNLLLRELDERPYNPGAWVSLGLQYENDGHKNHARVCYERAMACSDGNVFLSFREAGAWHAREARRYLAVAAQRLPAHHPMKGPTEEAVAFLSEAAPELTRLGLARRGEQPKSPAQLPDFPDPKRVEAAPAPEQQEQGGR